MAPMLSSKPGPALDSGSAARLDLSHLEGVLLTLFSAGVAPSTQRAYKSGCKRYLSFCSEAGITPFPASESSLCLFVSKLFVDTLSPQTVKAYLSAVRYSQISLGFGDPRLQSMPRLEYVVKGFKRSSRKRSTLRLPILPSHLMKLKGYWESFSPSHDLHMLWAAVCLCFLGFFGRRDSFAFGRWLRLGSSSKLWRC